MSELARHPGSVYIGCYTQGAGGEGIGITLARRDPSGALLDARVVALSPSPSFLVRHPSLPVIYAVNELAEGGLGAFEMAPDGGLVQLGSWSTAGAAPCHLCVADGHICVANYDSGSIAVFPLDAAGVPTGLSDLVEHRGHGPDPRRQQGPHVHMVVPTPGGVLAVDLGTDSVVAHELDPGTGRLGPAVTVAALPAGAGPRHLVRDQAGVAHVVGELDAMLTSYDVPPARDQRWREVSRVAASAAALPSGPLSPGPLQPSEVDISPDGRFLYVGNRGPDTVAVFSLTGEAPRRIAEVPAGGAWPRHLVRVGDLLYVANERSHAVTALRCDPATGVPSATGHALETPSPTCVLPVDLG